jgi:hypothetical protein
MSRTAEEPIDLSDFVKAQKTKSTEDLSASIEAHQQRMIDNLGWSRVGTYQKGFVASIGKIRLTVQRARKPGGGTTSPILDALSIRKKKYSDELRMRLASKASRDSYGKVQEDFEEETGITLPKTTIHSILQGVGSDLREAYTAETAALTQQLTSSKSEGPKISRQERRRKQREEEQRAARSPAEEKEEEQAPTTTGWEEERLIAVLGDGTKTQSVYPTLNNVNIAMTFSQKTHSKRIIGISVNKSWKKLGQSMRANGTVLPKDRVAVVSDADDRIAENIEHSAAHLDTVHAVKESLVKMWSEKASLEERKELSNEMKKELYTLVNSVDKHLKDGDKKALESRIDKTVESLKKLAEKMLNRGYPKTAEFIRTRALQMVTFAKIALTMNVRIPHTSNAIERLMGQISERCKHKWMHWSTRGLENMLWIVLVRYTDRKFLKRFWNSYIHPLRYPLWLATLTRAT